MLNIVDTAADCKLLHSNHVQDESALVLLRSKLFAITNRLGISELKRENVLLTVAELATNIIKHAEGRGMIQVWQQPGVLDILSLDYGAGIDNLALAEMDGFSTSNTFGKGFGAVRRLSDELYAYTQRRAAGPVTKWSGSVFLARFHLASGKEHMLGNDVGLFSRSLSDARHNGDRIYLRKKKNGVLRWLHLDGLGHGEEAKMATCNLAKHVAHDETVESVLAGVDRQLVSTRGAVATACEVDVERRSVQLAGVGDMHAHIFDEDAMQHVSFAPGILGREHRSATSLRTKLARRGVVITASDGIRRNWDIGNFAGLFNLHPQLIAYTLGNIMGRVSDDQSICVSTVGTNNLERK